MGDWKATPRPTVRMAWCPTCGRDDRWQPLKARHFSSGGLCPGELIVLVYSDPKPSDAR